jgi:hypothetical protein
MTANDKIMGLLSASSVRNTIMAETDKPVIIVDCDASWRDSFAALRRKRFLLSIPVTNVGSMSVVLQQLDLPAVHRSTSQDENLTPCLPA